MRQPRLTPEEAVRRGEEIYEQRLREQVEAGNTGKYIVIDVDSGAYEIGPDYSALLDQMLDRDPDAELAILRVGYPAVGRIGGRLKATHR
jgi:hypothetical protein